MKSTGIVRRTDELGRIVIPKEIRRTLQIREGDPLEMFVDGENIVVKKYYDPENCAVCMKYSSKHVTMQDGTRICNSCAIKIVSAWGSGGGDE